CLFNPIPIVAHKYKDLAKAGAFIWRCGRTTIAPVSNNCRSADGDSTPNVAFGPRVASNQPLLLGPPDATSFIDVRCVASTPDDYCVAINGNRLTKKAQWLTIVGR